MAENSTYPEQLSRDELRFRQECRLREMLAEILPRNPFWQRRCAAAGMTAETFRSLEDLRRLPCVTKEELAADSARFPPYGSNLTYPVTAYSRLHQTSGTTGAPLRWLDTPASWQWMLKCWEQNFRLLGLRPSDRLLFAFSFGPFLGFWAGFEGALQCGNLCLPGGGLSSEARLRFLLENEVTIICCTPTYALRLAEVADRLRMDLTGSSVRGLLVAGEAGGCIPSVRSLLEHKWGARLFDHWGMTEIGPLAMEAADDPGSLSVLETECIAEILNPETLEPVPAGQEGELVVTNLGRWGSPLLRYRTGDRVRAAASQRTGIGRALLRLEGGILGRTDDMLTIRGNNIYPAALEDAIRSIEGVEEYRIEVLTTRGMQQVRIEIEPGENSRQTGASLAEALSSLIKSRWNFQPEVQTVPVGTLPRYEFKSRRFSRREA